MLQAQLGLKQAAIVLLPLTCLVFLFSAFTNVPTNSQTSLSSSASDTCIQGYVWREAGPNDHVCVLPATRSQAASDNSQASSRVDPNGAYGPKSCIQGYVWREAFSGDDVCVTPSVRSQATDDNSKDASRKI
jgi:hypothetical protein